MSGTEIFNSVGGKSLYNDVVTRQRLFIKKNITQNPENKGDLNVL